MMMPFKRQALVEFENIDSANFKGEAEPSRGEIKTKKNIPFDTETFFTWWVKTSS